MICLSFLTGKSLLHTFPKEGIVGHLHPVHVSPLLEADRDVLGLNLG